jgi:adenylate cyclase
MAAGHTLARIRRQLPLAALILLVTTYFLAHALGVVAWRLLSRLENFAYDARVLLTMPATVDSRIVIVDIDEKSLAEIGHWPWSRDRLARLVELLVDHYGAIVVGFDVVFPEPDDTSGLSVLERLGREELRDLPQYVDRLGKLRDVLDYDRLFAESMRDRPIFLGYYFTTGGSATERVTAGVLPPPVFPQGAFADMEFHPPAANGYGANIPQLYASAAGSGHFTPSLDEDGIVRRVPMLYQYQGAYYEALSLAMVRYVFGVDELQADFIQALEAESRLYRVPERIVVGPLEIPIDERSQVLVPYRGRQGSFPYVSAADVLHARVAPDVLAGAIVLVGASAQGTYDLRSTPVQAALPGVEIHASIISGALDRGFKERPRYVAGAEFGLLLLTGVLMALLLPVLSAVAAATATALILVAYVGLNIYLWQGPDLVVPLAPGILMILVLFLLDMSWGFFVERRGKRQLSTLFGQYVPPELVDEMSVDPESYTLEAESRELTVLFTDIRGFTTISEHLTAGELSRLMNEYLTAMTRVIHDHRGTIDKYMGDAIMAFWGAPVEDHAHARRAVDTGMAMLERLNAIREEFLERGWPEIRIGVGISTGIMYVGNMGSKFRMAYTVIGDAVNLGSRLEGLTKQYGVEIIVSEGTRAAVPEYVYRELDRVRVKGKDEPIAIFEPVALGAEVSPAELDELERHHEALRCYQAQDWEGAGALFSALRTLSPQRKLYEIYLERIKWFRELPPGPDWDGVYTFTTK